eukprot:scaffold24667_cov31-Prasinocladus_malaysianus.AAC.2
MPAPCYCWPGGSTVLLLPESRGAVMGRRSIGRPGGRWCPPGCWTAASTVRPEAWPQRKGAAPAETARQPKSMKQIIAT